MSEQARIPMDNLERTIADMMPGDQGWTVPWAVFLDDDDQVFINGKYSLDSRPAGTITMSVRRDNAGDLHVINHEPDRKFGRGDCYVGGADPLPVHFFTTASPSVLLDAGYPVEEYAQPRPVRSAIHARLERDAEVKRLFDARPRSVRCWLVTKGAARLWAKAIAEQYPERAPAEWFAISRRLLYIGLAMSMFSAWLPMPLCPIVWLPGVMCFPVSRLATMIGYRKEML